MSLMKQYADDTEHFRLRAIETAWMPEESDRSSALKRLIADCSTAATVYHWPAAVTALFVNTVSETYAAEWMAQKEQTA